MALSLQHLNQTVEALAHLLSTMVLDDKRHLELRMLFELIELPRMEIGDKIAILLEHPTRHPVIECLGQIVQSEPEQRKTDQRSDGSRYLHHTILHKPGARFRKMHITPRNKGRIQ